jgi:hypothetical protein
VNFGNFQGAPAIEIKKYVSVDDGITWEDAETAPGPTATFPGTVKFKVVVTNTGNVDLTGVVVTDSDFTFTGVVSTLAQGASDESDILSVASVVGQHENTADVEAYYNATQVTDSDMAHYFCQEQEVGDTFCSFTQGFWGNAGGTGCDPEVYTIDLLIALLDAADASTSGADPVIVGQLGERSIKFDTADCIVALLPASGPAKALNGSIGDKICGFIPTSLVKNGRLNNVLIGQVVALELNIRLYGIVACHEEMGDLGAWPLLEEFCTQGEEGCAEKFYIPESLVGENVADLLMYANQALAGTYEGEASIGEINAAVTAVNEAFDECRTIVDCPETETICDDGCDNDFDGLTDCVEGYEDPDCECDS